MAATILIWQFAIARDTHIRALVLGLGGALSLVIPPVRQAFRNYPYRRISIEESGAIPREIIEALIRRQNAAFVEFSWIDVVCFSLGPLLLSAAFVLDMVHEGTLGGLATGQEIQHHATPLGTATQK